MNKRFAKEKDFLGELKIKARWKPHVGTEKQGYEAEST
jgi:hypothetical protein